MSIWILTLLNIALVLVAFVFSYRAPMADLAIKSAVVLIDIVFFIRMIIEGEYVGGGIQGDQDISRKVEPFRYWLGALWVLLMAFACGGVALIWHR